MKNLVTGFLVLATSLAAASMGSAQSNWTHHDINTRKPFLDSCFANGRFVAVGVDGLVATSITARSWEVKNAAPNSRLHDYRAITHNGWAFVLMADDETVTTTRNGRDFSPPKRFTLDGRTQNVTSAASSKGLAYGKGVYVSTVYGKLWHAGSPYHWHTAPVPADLRNVTFYDVKFIAPWGVFVAVGSGATIAVSTDGKRWVRYYSRSDGSWRGVVFRGIAYGDGTLAVTGRGKVAVTTTNLRSWKTVVPPYSPDPQRPSHDDMIDIAFGNGAFMAVGQSPTGGRVIRRLTESGWAAPALVSGRADFGRGAIASGNGVFTTTTGPGNIATFTIGPPDPHYQPDVSISSSQFSSKVGSGIIGNYWNQTLSKRMRARRSTAFHFHTRNSGNQRDTFRMIGTRGNREYRIRWYEGSTDHTTSITRGGKWFNVDPGKTHHIKAVVTSLRRASRHRKKSMSIFGRALSVKDPTKSDAVRGIVRLR